MTTARLIAYINDPRDEDDDYPETGSFSSANKWVADEFETLDASKAPARIAQYIEELLAERFETVFELQNDTVKANDEKQVVLQFVSSPPDFNAADPSSYVNEPPPIQVMLVASHFKGKREANSCATAVKKHFLGVDFPGLFEDILPAADRQNYGFYRELLKPADKKLPENVQNERKAKYRKELNKNMWMAMRWLSCDADSPEFAIIMVNEYLNVRWSALTGEDHDELRWLLAASTGTGYDRNRRIKGLWPGVPMKGRGLDAAGLIVASLFPGSKKYEIEALLSENSAEELREWALGNGIDKERVDEAWPE